MSYSKLLKHIQSIQSTFDEADIYEFEGGHDMDESDISAWLEAKATKGHILDQLNQISIDANLEISLVNLLPTPGSLDWYYLQVF
ncbi:hypothetical protein DFH28DRAFT_1123389 [Melampsora americana]|nr:hypothetical protein DFH28DRAFT_1123389 [Melampsora americana]